MAAFPKKIGSCIDNLVALRSKRKEVEREAESIKDQEKALEEHLLREFGKAALDGARGSKGSAKIDEKDTPRVTDWEAFYAYIHKNKAWELLQKRPGERACQERWEENEEIPGVEKFKVIKLTITEAK
jgi:hypothetical protein